MLSTGRGIKVPAEGSPSEIQVDDGSYPGLPDVHSDGVGEGVVNLDNNPVRTIPCLPPPLDLKVQLAWRYSVKSEVVLLLQLNNGEEPGHATAPCLFPPIDLGKIR